MKKIFFSVLASSLAAIGLSAFKTSKTTTVSYYWFSINSGVSFNVTDIPPGLINSEVVYFQTSTTIPSAMSPCDEGNTYQCLVGYSSYNVLGTSPASYVLKTTGGSVQPQTAPHGFGHFGYVRSTK